MQTARRITRNFLSLSVAEIFSKVVQLFVFVYVARVFGDAEFGKFSFGLSFGLLLFVVADFGFGTFLIREISRNKEMASKYLSNSMTLKIGLAIATFLTTWIFLQIFKYPQDMQIITYLMVGFIVIQSFTSLFYAVFRAFERMHFDAIVKVIRMVLLAGSVLFAIFKGKSIVYVTAMFPLTEIVILGMTAWIIQRKFVPVRFSFQGGFGWKLLKESSLFSLSLAFVGVYVYIDTIMLSRMRGPAEVGIYTAAYNPLLALVFIPMMYSNAIFPVLSQYFVDKKEQLLPAYERSFKYMLILGLPISLGTIIFAKNIIHLFYGTGYEASILALQILAGFLFLRFLNIVSGTTLSAINQQKSRVFAQGLTALVNVVLNLLFIPKWGLIGAGIATLVTEVVFFFLYLYYIVRYGLKIRFIATSIRPVVAAVAMALVVMNFDHLWTGAIIGTAVYMALLLLLGAFDAEDKRLLKKIVQNQ